LLSYSQQVSGNTRGDIAFGTVRTADPASPFEGDTWYNSTLHCLRYYNGTENVCMSNSFPGIQKTLFVDKSSVTGLEDGTVQNPFHTIADALTEAATLTPAAGNKIAIIIYPGVYSESGLASQDYVYLVGVNRDTCIVQNAATILTISHVNFSITALQFDATSTNAVISASGAMASACEINNCLIKMTGGSSGAAFSIASGAKVEFYTTKILQNTTALDAIVMDSNSGNELLADELYVEGYIDIDGGTTYLWDYRQYGQIDVGGSTTVSLCNCWIRNDNNANTIELGTTGDVFMCETQLRSVGLSGGTDYRAMNVTVAPNSMFMCGTKFIWTVASPDYLVYSSVAFSFLGKGNSYHRGMNGNCVNLCTSVREVHPTCGTEYNIIDDALAAASAGDVVHLAPETFDVTDSVDITTDDITVVGIGATIRALTATWVGGVTNNDAVVNVGATDGTAPNDNVKLEDFEISCEPNIHGLQVNGGAGNAARRIMATSTALKSSLRVGILFTDASASAGERFTVQDCVIQSSSDANAWVDGVHVDGNNTLSTYGYGNGIVDSIIQGNYVTYALETCYVFVDCSSSAIFVNRAKDVCYNAGGVGMAMIGCQDCLADGNSVIGNNNAGSSSGGYIRGCSGCVFESNAIDGDGTDFPVGIDLNNDSDNNIIRNNTLRDCTTGIDVDSGCDLNQINPNQFISGITTRIADADTSNRYTGTGRQGTGNPNGSESGNFNDTYLNSNNNRLYKCISYPMGTSWRVI